MTVAPSWMPGKIALEQACLPDDHVDHVDAARPLVLVLALDVDEGLDRARRVGQEDVVVGRVEGRRPRAGDREHGPTIAAIA